MKGFKDSNNKFHPITDNKKGVRKSRDQKVKTEGVKIRKQRGLLVNPTSLPDEVRRKFTQDELETLVNIRDSFNESGRYIDRILEGDDLDMNLYYVVHDWIGERGKDYNRNDELVRWLLTLAEAQERIGK